MEILIEGGEAFWYKTKERKEKYGKINPFKKPVHVKFIGDGALYVLTF